MHEREKERDREKLEINIVDRPEFSYLPLCSPTRGRWPGPDASARTDD